MLGFDILASNARKFRMLMGISLQEFDLLLTEVKKMWREASAATEWRPLILRKRKDRTHNVPDQRSSGLQVPRTAQHRSQADMQDFGQFTTQPNESEEAATVP